jgi:hypothetical protein
MKKIYLTIFYFLFFAACTQAQKTSGFVCGVNARNYTAEIRQAVKNLDPKKAARMKVGDLPMLECQVAVTVDKSMYEYYNRDKDAIRNYVYQLFAKVSDVYEKEMNIKVTVSYIEFWEAREFVSIQNFELYWSQISQQKVKRNINHLLKTGHLKDGSSGVAYVGYPFSVTAQVNTMRATQTIAHEIGHNFGSPHTHDCEWPGGPLDLCGRPDCEGFSTYEDGIGTIMSYCAERGYTFHPLCAQIIRTYAEKELGIISSLPQTPVIASENLAQSNTNLQTYLNWNYSDRVSKYTIQISESASFSSPFIDSTIHYNQFQTVRLANGKKYFWRLKAINQKGETGWSATAEFTTKASNGIPETPIIKSPLFFEEDVSVGHFSFYPIPDATEYEIELLDDESFIIYGVRPQDIITTQQANVTIDLSDETKRSFRVPRLMWRVRAKNDQGVSEWSRYNFFRRSVIITNNYPTEGKTDIPPKTVFSWLTRETYLNKKAELQVSSTADFSSDVITEPFVLGQYYQRNTYLSPEKMQVVDLKPATKYYYRLRDADRPGVVWAKSSFRTAANDTELKKWKYLYDKSGALPTENKLFARQPGTDKFWIMRRGLVQTDGVNWQEVYNIKNLNGPFGGTISSITSDSKGNIWMTSYQYLTRLSDTGPVVYNTRNGPVKGDIESIVIGKGDITYIFTSRTEPAHGLYMYTYDGKDWTENTTPFNMYSTSVVHLDEENNIWVTQPYGSGVMYRLSGTTWTPYPYDRFAVRMDKLYSDSNGNIWGIGVGGLARMTKNGEWSYIKVDNHQTYTEPCMAFDNKGIPYVAFTDVNQQTKLYKYVDGQWIDLTRNATPIDANFGYMVGMNFDSKNRLWLCPSNLNMFIYDEKGADNLKPQTIEFEKVAPQSTDTAPFALKATASSGLPVTFTVMSGPASVSGNMLTLSGKTGNIRIRISQEGNAQYEPARFAEFSFDVIQKRYQEIMLFAMPALTTGDTLHHLAYATSGLLPTYTVVAGPAIIKDNSYIQITGAGRIKIKVTQEGNQFYFAAPEAISEFCAKPLKPLIKADIANPFLLTSNSTTGNQWYYNKVKIEGATTASYLTDKNGQYSVEALNPDPTCPSSVSDIFEVLILANEPTWTKEIRLFPNPVSTKLALVAPSGISVEKLTIYDITGKKVYDTGRAEAEYDISGLAKGVFLIAIQTIKGKTLRKIVKE